MPPALYCVKTGEKYESKEQMLSMRRENDNKKQKIQVEMLDRTKFNGQLVSKDDKTMTLENNGSTQTILVKDIYEIKVVKFSILKTFGNVAKGGAWVAAAAGIFLVIAIIGV